MFQHPNLKTSVFPTSIDINPTAKCNLSCSFCWGPNHTIEDGLSTADWKAVLSFFTTYGTSSVVLTGGEPLIRRDLAEIVRFAKRNLGLHLTLSTNTLLLKKKAPDVLAYVDEIG